MENQGGRFNSQQTQHLRKNLPKCIKPQCFSEPCKAGYSCFETECSSDNGPDQLLQGLESTPNTPIFAATRALYNNLLKELRCPYDEDTRKQQQYCCCDFASKISEGKKIPDENFSTVDTQKEKTET